MSIAKKKASKKKATRKASGRSKAEQPSTMEVLMPIVEMTIEVLRDSSIVDYLPTLIVPSTQTVQAIEGIPAKVDHATAIQNVVRRNHLTGESLFFCVRIAPDMVTVGLHTPGNPAQCAEILVKDDSFTVSGPKPCAWWKV